MRIECQTITWGRIRHGQEAHISGLENNGVKPYFEARGRVRGRERRECVRKIISESRKSAIQLCVMFSASTGPFVSRVVILCLLLRIREILFQTRRFLSRLWHINIKTVTFSNSQGLANSIKRKTTSTQYITTFLTNLISHNVCDLLKLG